MPKRKLSPNSSMRRAADLAKSHGQNAPKKQKIRISSSKEPSALDRSTPRRKYQQLIDLPLSSDEDEDSNEDPINESDPAAPDEVHVGWLFENESVSVFAYRAEEREITGQDIKFRIHQVNKAMAREFTRGGQSKIEYKDVIFDDSLFCTGDRTHTRKEDDRKHEIRAIFRRKEMAGYFKPKSRETIGGEPTQAMSNSPADLSEATESSSKSTPGLSLTDDDDFGHDTPESSVLGSQYTEYKSKDHAGHDSQTPADERGVKKAYCNVRTKMRKRRMEEYRKALWGS